MEDEPQLVLANKIVDNMAKVIKELAKHRRMVSIENPRGSTLWSHPSIQEFTDTEVLVLVQIFIGDPKFFLGIDPLFAASRLNHRAFLPHHVGRRQSNYIGAGTFYSPKES